MDEVLVYIAERQRWIYLFFGLMGLLYLWMAWSRFQEMRAALFRLERQRARSRLGSALGGLALAALGLVATFLLSTFVAPPLQTQAVATPLPTVSLIGGTPEAPAASATEPPTPLPETEFSSAGCENPEATILEPEDGDTVSGLVELKGTANIANFAFYKFEIRPLGSEAPWRPIWADTRPVVEDSLGVWDTSLVSAGDYALRLVVTDTQGNAPMPCVIRVRVVPPASP